MDNDIKNLLNITDPNITFKNGCTNYEIRNGKKVFIIKGTLAYKAEFCEKCGQHHSENIHVKDYYTTEIKIPRISNFTCYLQLRKLRFKCLDCGKTFSTHTDFIDENCQISKYQKYTIALMLRENLTRKYIAQHNDVSQSTVVRVMDNIAESFIDNHKRLPRVLKIDEFRSVNDELSFICIDGDSPDNKIIAILDKRRFETIASHFLQFKRNARLKVEIIVMDMNSNYGKLTQTIFPRATIVTDRFHIIQHINRNLDDLRCDIMKTFNKTSKEYTHLKKHGRLLLLSPNNIDYTNRYKRRAFGNLHLTQQDIIDRILGYSEELKAAYNDVIALKIHFEYRDYDSFLYVLQNMDKSVRWDFRRKFQVFTKGHLIGVRNAFYSNYSNGSLEGLNNKIKCIKRVAYGYRSFRNFRNRVYIIQGFAA
jgi:transposase